MDTMLKLVDVEISNNYVWNSRKLMYINIEMFLPIKKHIIAIISSYVHYFVPRYGPEVIRYLYC